MKIVKMSLFHNRNFLIHWLSLAIAQTGSFFTLIAMPLLVLAVSNNDPLVMTSVMAVMSLPNAIFIVVGGALVDKFSPMRFLIIARALFTLVMGFLVACIFLDFLPLWLIYIVAFLLGVLGSIGVPASQSLLPVLVESLFLQKANALVMGTIQLAQVSGPLLVGWLLWLAPMLFAGLSWTSDYFNLGLAFLVDAIAALLSLVLLFAIRMPIKGVIVHMDDFLTLFKRGISYCWSDKAIRTVLFYLLVVSLFLQGPMLAALPLIIKVKLQLSDSLFGILYALIGVGSLIGAGLSVLVRPRTSQLGMYVLCCDLMSGLSFSALSFASGPIPLGFLLLCIGISSGFIMVAGITWFQQRSAPEYMGRVMGILMFSVAGLVPVTTTLTGFFINELAVDVVVFFAGAIVVVLTLFGLMIKPIRNMGNAPLPPQHIVALSAQC